MGRGEGDDAWRRRRGKGERVGFTFSCEGHRVVDEMYVVDCGYLVYRYDLNGGVENKFGEGTWVNTRT